MKWPKELAWRGFKNPTKMVFKFFLWFSLCLSNLCVIPSNWSHWGVYWARPWCSVSNNFPIYPRLMLVSRPWLHRHFFPLEPSISLFFLWCLHAQDLGMLFLGKLMVCCRDDIFESSWHETLCWGVVVTLLKIVSVCLECQIRILFPRLLQDVLGNLKCWLCFAISPAVGWWWFDCGETVLSRKPWVLETLYAWSAR